MLSLQALNKQLRDPAARKKKKAPSAKERADVQAIVTRIVQAVKADATESGTEERQQLSHILEAWVSASKQPDLVPPLCAIISQILSDSMNQSLFDLACDALSDLLSLSSNANKHPDYRVQAAATCLQPLVFVVLSAVVDTNQDGFLMSDVWGVGARIKASELIDILIKKRENVEFLENNHPKLFANLLIAWSSSQDSSLQFCLLKLVTRCLKGASPEFIIKHNLSSDLLLIKSNEDLRAYLYHFNGPNEPLVHWPKTFKVKNLLYRVGKPQKLVADLKCSTKDSFWLDFNADYFSVVFENQMKEQCESQMDYSKLVSFSVDHHGIRLTLQDPFNASESFNVDSHGPFHIDLLWAPGFVAGGPNSIIKIMNKSQVVDNSPVGSQLPKFSMPASQTHETNSMTRGESNFNTFPFESAETDKIGTNRGLDETLLSLAGGLQMSALSTSQISRVDCSLDQELFEKTISQQQQQHQQKSKFDDPQLRNSSPDLLKTADKKPEYPTIKSTTKKNLKETVPDPFVPAQSPPPSLKKPVATYKKPASAGPKLGKLQEPAQPIVPKRTKIIKVQSVAADASAPPVPSKKEKPRKLVEKRELVDTMAHEATKGVEDPKPKKGRGRPKRVVVAKSSPVVGVKTRRSLASAAEESNVVEPIKPQPAGKAGKHNAKKFMHMEEGQNKTLSVVKQSGIVGSMSDLSDVSLAVSSDIGIPMGTSLPAHVEEPKNSTKSSSAHTNTNLHPQSPTTELCPVPPASSGKSRGGKSAKRSHEQAELSADETFVPEKFTQSALEAFIQNHSESVTSVAKSKKPAVVEEGVTILPSSSRRQKLSIVGSTDGSSIAQTPTRLSSTAKVGSTTTKKSFHDLTKLAVKATVEKKSNLEVQAAGSVGRKVTGSAKRQVVEQVPIVPEPIVRKSSRRLGYSKHGSSVVKAQMPWSKSYEADQVDSKKVDSSVAKYEADTRRVVGIESSAVKTVKSVAESGKNSAKKVEPANIVSTELEDFFGEDQEHELMDEFVGVEVQNPSMSGKSNRSISYTTFTEELVSTSPASNHHYTLKRKMEMKTTLEHSRKKTRTSTTVTPPFIADLTSDEISVVPSDGQPSQFANQDPFLPILASMYEKCAKKTVQEISQKFIRLAVSKMKINPDNKINNHLGSRSNAFKAISDSSEWSFKTRSLDVLVDKMRF
ncbi:hypothetical protein BDR26DRAFT_850490 [Obelidium mucronatum]|nr:hypothetical protein BDR26DRAFT_850490 [Obelidium mucronatum]